MLIQSVFHLAFGKDDVPCLDMPARHTRTSRGTEALALFRGGGRDGKRLARGVETSRIPASVKPANPRSRRRNWIFLTRTHSQVSSVDRCGPGVPRQCAHVLQNADEAVTKARAVASAEPTELHIGYSPTPVAEILPKILRAFQRKMPKVHVRLHDWSNNAILNGIREGRLQLGLIVPPLKAITLHDVRFEELFHERVCVAVALQHPFA